ATGQWRAQEDGVAIDASGVLPDGTRFEGPAGLRRGLLRQPDLLATAGTEKLPVYALRRGPEYYDAPARPALRRRGEKEGHSLQALILGVTRSAPFRMRTTEPAAPR